MMEGHFLIIAYCHTDRRGSSQEFTHQRSANTSLTVNRSRTQPLSQQYTPNALLASAWDKSFCCDLFGSGASLVDLVEPEDAAAWRPRSLARVTWCLPAKVAEFSH